MIQGGHAAANGGHGLTITGGDGATISDFLSYSNEQHGIAVTGGVGVLIQGCTCTNNSQLTDNVYSGISLVTVTGARVIGNKAGDFFITPPNRQRFGINVSAASAVNCRVESNDVRGNVTGGLVDLGTGTYRRGNFVSTGPQQGRAVLVNGTVTVNTTEILAGDNVQLTRVVGAGTTRGTLTVGTIVAATSFVVRAEDLAGALSADDDSTIFWEIVH